MTEPAAQRFSRADELRRQQRAEQKRARRQYQRSCGLCRARHGSISAAPVGDRHGPEP